ncbi:MAG TPA: hypothetical protein VMP67_07300 [Candidatus Limnocylindria bacterium]|nr:hypothetical protein [Candidatus Limnocylindria bacterium]
MERSIATTAPRTARRTARLPAGQPARGRLRAALERADVVHIGVLFVFLALAVYLLSNPERRNFYNHFVWQAEAFLDGRFAVRFPVAEGPHVNAYFQDVMPLPERPGFGLIPFPPLPALLITPLVAIFGLATNAALVAVVVGALNVGLAWRMVTRLTEDRAAAVLATLFFAFGTVHWYAAMLGSTWFLAHVFSITFLLLAVTLAIDGNRRPAAAVPPRGGLRRWLEPSQFGAGLLFGLACLSRLTIAFGAPFFAFVGAGGSFWRRAFSAGLGAFIPLVALIAYNVVATGHVFHPAYQWLYQHEYLGYLPEWMAIDRSWLIQDPRFIPMNSLILLAWPPVIRPECGLSLFDPTCPLLRPDQTGMSILLTSPAYLLALPVLRRAWRQPLVQGAALAVLSIVVINLMHFSQGWVQFGYRFSNDFAPFALMLVTLGIAGLGVRRLTIGLVLVSILVNAWGVYWGVRLGW